MLNRRDLLTLATVGIGATAVTGRVPLRAADRPFRILMVTPEGEAEVERGFRDYFSGENIAVDFTSRAPGPAFPDIAAFLQSMPEPPDLIYTAGTPLTLSIVGPYDAPDPAAFVRDLPVVFAMVAAPLQARIVRSLEHPGGNVTGAVQVVPTDVQLRAMQTYRPFKTVGILHSAGEPDSAAIVEQVQAYCEGIGARVAVRTFHTDADGRPVPDGVEDLLKQLKAEGADWLYLLPDRFLATMYGQVAPAALALGLPSFGATESSMREGGALVGLVSRYYWVGQLAASKAAEILAGHKAPGTIPVETLKRFSLIINVTSAKTLGIYPPIEMLNYAEVISS